MFIKGFYVLELIKFIYLNMKSKAFLVSFLALLAMAFVLTSVSATDFVDVSDVEVNGVSYNLDSVPEDIAVSVSETIPVVVKFTAEENVSDVRVKAYIEGYRDEISDETSRFHILEDNTYIKRLSLKLPSTIDLDDLDDEIQLLVRVSAKEKESVEVFVPLEIQKYLYDLNLLSIEAPEVVYAGSTVAIDVVVENNGYDRLDNVYLKASIPGLGIERKVYVGDLESVVDEYDDDVNDARAKRVYLTVPRNVIPGNYELEIEAYNYDTSVTSTGRIVVRDVETGVIPSVTSKTVAPGKETSFNLVLVNPNDRMVVYTITPEESKGLIVEVTEPVVTVGADSSKNIEVKVRAANNAEEGTYLVTVNANSEAGLQKQVSFSVNVEKSSRAGVTGAAIGERTNTAVVLTVILVIVFIVLLIVLIVLLTKRPEEQEELGETNYY